MLFDDFIKKYTGVGVDTDGYYGGQCMDLMHRYCVDVLGLADLRILAFANAKGVYLNFNNVFGHDLFEKIDNTPTGVPLKGDIVFYGNGPDGHVDMFIQGDVNSYRSFSQNLPTGSKSNVINHPNYNGVLGWLRYKKPVPEPMATITQKELNSIIEARNKNWDLIQSALQTNNALVKKIEELQKEIAYYPLERSVLNEIIKHVDEIQNQIKRLG